MKILASFRPQVSYHKSGLIRASEPIIFKVISQTQKYPTFIPWVNSSKIVKQISPTQNITKLIISYNNFKELSYSSHVKMHQAGKIGEKSWIHSVCHDAPLKKLDSLWQIQGKDQNSAIVNYKLNFEFSSPLYQLASSVLKDYMGEQMWDLFQKQALIEQVKSDRIRKQAIARQSTQPKTAANTVQNPQQEQVQSLLASKPLSSSQQPAAPAQTNPSIQECKILKLSNFLNQNPQLKQIYNQSTLTRKKIEQLHVRLQPMPDYESQMQRQIKKLVSQSRMQNSKM